jgi:siderophore synthetase component
MKATLEPLDLDRDLGLLHAWVTHPRSVYWEMPDASLSDVAAEYARIAADPHHDAWLGRVDGEPAFLAETYDPFHSPLASLAEVRPGDLGMHVLVAPPVGPAVPGFTRLVFRAVLEHCFSSADVQRVVVDPDVRNARIAAMNAAFGFEVARVVELPSKVAALSFCTRSAFEGPAAHLSPERLAVAQRHLVAKAISEYAHERLLSPAPDASGWRLTAPDGRSSYTFGARRLALEHWAIEDASLTRWVGGAPAELDLQRFVAEFAEPLGIPDALLPTYLEELASTLASACWKLAHSSLTSADLLDADYQAIEAAMTEGHPGFVANNGRIGYDLADYTSYAPETGAAVRLEWLAARRTLARLSLGDGLSEARLYDELAAATRAGFAATLRGLGLEPDDYLYLPVHPWQWRHQLAITFAPDLARRDLVHLGTGPDDYRAQQSIRTFFNTSQPERHYVKTALSIQNMGFKRGLSPRYMGATPAINDWVHRLVEDDPTLKGCGFTVLRERAAIGYTGDAFHGLDVRSPYQKMVAALWRESPVPLLSRGERLASMTSLLHRDAAGSSLVGELIAASPLDAASWLRSYLHAYVRPVVHCLLAHELAFMPHGENLVLVLRDHVPVRALMKDVGEEVAVMSPAIPLPEEVERIRVDVPADIKALALHTDVFDGFLRHLAAILDTDGVLSEADFWAAVRDCVETHAAEHPELALQIVAYDLQRAEFKHSCLNRLQLLNTLEMVDISDQASSLQYAGTLANPIARVEGVGPDR